MLRHKHITPLPGMVEELVKEVGGNVDEIRFEDYIELYEIIHFRAGFTSTDLTKLQAYFSRYDRDGSATLDVQELRAVLSWANRAGLASGQDELDALMAEVEPIPGTDVLTEVEYFRIMRLHRERMLAKVERVVRGRDRDDAGYLSFEELPAIFEDLGYAAASRAVLQQAVLAAGLGEAEDSGRPLEPQPLGFEGICLILDCFAETEGFTQAELKELGAAFDAYRSAGEAPPGQLSAREADDTDDAAPDGEQCISPIGLEGALRWLGYPTALWQLQELLDQFDLDESSQLSYGEFLKVMATLREAEHRQIRRAITEAPRSRSLAPSRRLAWWSCSMSSATRSRPSRRRSSCGSPARKARLANASPPSTSGRPLGL